jgi:2-polyprenyl-6-methoxyphenol hydroxylase-like FAD-dependent oxidoreductase
MDSVLVVGAGPTGLTMACELARHGIPLRIIDRAPKPSDKSKALVIQARTMEVFEQMGIAEDVWNRGEPLWVLNPHVDGQPVGSLDFKGLDSPFPCPLILEQSETERVLS